MSHCQFAPQHARCLSPPQSVLPEYATNYFQKAAILILMATVAIGRHRETMGTTSIHIEYDRAQWESTFLIIIERRNIQKIIKKKKKFFFFLN